MAKKTEHKNITAIESTVAKTDDGGMQVTFSIPQNIVEKEEEHVLSDLQKTTTVPGFRKGKAPIAKVKEQTKPETLMEKTLLHILPTAFANAVAEHKLRPAVLPKFEVLSMGEVWQVRANTCEILDFDLGDYKKIVSQALKDEKKEATREQKEAKAMQVLLDATTITVPQMLIEEEVNARLAQLLERIEKLGLTLEGYLSSLGKKVEDVRGEYEVQTKDAIKLELILNKIADTERIVVSDDEVKKTIQASGLPAKATEDERQQRAVASILRRRAVLDSLIG